MTRGVSSVATASGLANPPASLEGQPVDLTADEFFAMIEAGLFAPERRVLLWGGRIYEKMAKTLAHATTSAKILRALSSHLPEDWVLWPENPIRLDALHAPLPDIPIVRGPADRYLRDGHHPTPEEVGLLVEIAVTSLPRDLGKRAETFARALIPVYWVADAIGRKIVEHSQPRSVDELGTYNSVRVYVVGEEIPFRLDGVELARFPVADLFPKG